MGATLLVTAALGGLIIANGKMCDGNKLDYAVGSTLVGLAAFFTVFFYA